MNDQPEVKLSCPACGAPQVERVNTFNNSTFLGCSDWPRCTETQKVPAFLEVKRAGGVELPGFEMVASKPESGRYPS